MKLLLIIVAVLVVVASFFADYKWKQWIATRKAAREQDHRGIDRHQY